MKIRDWLADPGAKVPRYLNHRVGPGQKLIDPTRSYLSMMEDRIFNQVAKGELDPALFKGTEVGLIIKGPRS